MFPLIFSGLVAMIVLLIILVFLVSFFCLLPYFRAMYKRWRYWEDPANDPRWSNEQFQFSTSPRLAREPIYNRLSNSTLDSSPVMGSRLGSRVGLNREGSFRNSCLLPRDPDQVEIRIPPSFAEFINQGNSQSPAIKSTL